MPELTPINFNLIQRLQEKLHKEMLTWKENPMNWEEMIEQYRRIHNPSTLTPNNMTDKMIKVCEKCFWFKLRTNGAYSCSLGKYPVIADGYNPCGYLKEK